MGRYVGVAFAGRGDCALDDSDPVFDVADRLFEIADGGFDARQAVVHDAIRDAIADRFA